MESQLPDLVVGVDFGMTCTGVAYQNLSARSETVQWINKWPGRSQAAENKVPTVLVYPRDAPSYPTSWGFQSEEVSEQLDKGKTYCEWFKVLLDGKNLEEKQRSDANAPRSVDEVRKWCIDYLRKLHDHIEYKLAAYLPRPWREAAIEYIFSVPTTWSPVVVERFREIVESSGFGNHKRHRVIMDLTEAEAVAVFSSKETPGIFRPRDILLVCDAGGGTTDLSILRVLSTSGESIQLEQLDVVQGRSIGSTAIDYGFQELIRRRLEEADQQIPLGINIAAASWEMMKSKEFQNIKCEMGSPDEPPRFKLPIHGLAANYKDHVAGIDSGFLSFTRGDLQRLFDQQIEKIFELLDQQLNSMQAKMTNERITHLVLSGGLGNSGYVHQRLSAWSHRCHWPCAQGIQVRLSTDPQLAVCKGMIVNRVQKLRSKRSVIGIRCCRSSYGTLCKEEYRASYPYHRNVAPEMDPFNQKLYVTNVVEWFIKKGEPVNENTPIVRQYKRRLPEGDPALAIESTLVTCDLEPDRLPYRNTRDVKHLCSLKASLPSSEGVVHRDSRLRLWKKGRAHVQLDFEIKIVIGPADLRFELWRNGAKMNGERSIKVDFTQANDYVPPPKLDTSRRFSQPLGFPSSLSSPTSPPNLSLVRSMYIHPDSSGMIPVSSEFHAEAERDLRR